MDHCKRPLQRLPLPSNLGNHVISVAARNRRNLSPLDGAPSSGIKRTIWIDTMFRSLCNPQPLFHGLHRFEFTGVRNSQPLMTTGALLQFARVYHPRSDVQFLSGSQGSFLSQQEESLPREPLFFKSIVTYAVLQKYRLSTILVRPRRGSNSQPTDSKSGTLSIELRGRYGDYTRRIPSLLISRIAR